VTARITRRSLLSASLSASLLTFSCTALGDEPAGPPPRVLAGYWPTWVPDALRVVDLPVEYTQVRMFAATPRPDGSLSWPAPGDGRGARANLRGDVQRARSVQGRSVLLSVGGAGNALALDSRTVSARLVDGVRRLVDEGFGGLDGIDLNTFEGDTVPTPAEYAWVSSQLKAAYGPAFLVSVPPAPWRDEDKAFCRDLARDGLLDLCGPQYYDDPGLTDEQYIVDSVGEWAGLVGPDRLVVGFGLGTDAGYLSIDRCASAWRRVAEAVPGVRGAYCWNTATDEASGWRFATDVGRLVRP
jgi:chitinase